MLDLILSGSLKKSSVEALLISSSGVLLEDNRRVKSACEGKPKLQVVAEEWSLHCNRILAAYDQILTYFDAEDSEILESAFEIVSVGLFEQGKLVSLLPENLQPAVETEEEFFEEQELEQLHVASVERLETLVGRKAEGPLERYVTCLIRRFQKMDFAILEELDGDDAEAYRETSTELFAKLRALYRQDCLDERFSILETVEELMEERRSFQQELLAET